MLVERVLIEYHGSQYSLPVLLVGSANGKLADRGLAEKLDEAIDGQRPVVDLDDGEARAFYAAASGIAVTMDRENVDWHRLLAVLRADSSHEHVSRSQIRIRTATSEARALLNERG
jgi:hypothetical protein